MVPAADNDTSSFFGQQASGDVPRDQWKRYILPDPRTGEKVGGWTRATTFAATIAESYALQIWKQRQVVWGLSRRPDLITMASTISGPEDKAALGAIVDEAHIAGGTDAKANRGTSIHRACQAAELGRYAEVPEELRPHVGGYFAAVKDAGLQILPEYVERVVIVDRYHVAGQLDNLVLCPDGKIRVLDKKTGNLDYADVEFAVQLATYAHADAMFNYQTGRYEAMPEVATDYAIIAHIDPETGRTELQRVNIELGWLWARTCAEVMDIRKTKHVITPYVPDMVRPSTTFAPREDYWQSVANEADAADRAAAFVAPAVTHALSAQPIQQPGPNAYVVSAGPSFGSVGPGGLTEEQRYTADAAQLAQQLGYPNAFGVGANVGGPQGIVTQLNGELRSGQWVPGGTALHQQQQHDFDTSAFWDDHLDEQDDIPINGVPLAQYGQLNQYPCASGQPCEFTGQGGLHSDGTVCLYGNARPAPVQYQCSQEPHPGREFYGDGGCAECGYRPPVSVVPGEQVQWINGTMMVQRNGQWVPGAEQTLEQATTGLPIEITQQTGVVAEDLGGINGASPLGESTTPADTAPDDEMVGRVMKAHKDKAAMQKLATQLMTAVGIKEGDPEGIKLAQYKADLANAIVTLAYRRGVEVPELGVPAGPGHPKTKGKATAAEKKAAAKSAEDTAAQAAKDRAEVIATAVRSIQQQGTIAGLSERHDYYAQTSTGWTEEMQVAARTRAAEIEQEAGNTALTPEQMIDGATSAETLAKAYTVATNNRQNLAGWTAALNDKAQAKHAELQRLAMSVNQ